MIRKFWVQTAVGCLTFAIISVGVIADGFGANRDPGGGRGSRGGGGRSMGSGGRSGGGGTIHAPARGGGGGARSSANRGNSPAMNRTPSFSSPSGRSTNAATGLRSNSQSGGNRQLGGNTQLGSGSGRPNNAQSGAAAALRTNVGVGNNTSIQNNTSIRNNVGIRNDVGNGNNVGIRNNVGNDNNVGIRGGNTNTLNRVGNTNVGINNQTLGGNSITLGNRNVNLAANGYHPSYNRHQIYHGSWNGNYGHNNWGYGLAYGVGYNQGFNSSYYNNYRYYRPLGWGLGAWGLGRLAYGSGYLGYSNPYYNGYAGYNYSQPITVSYSDTSATGITTADDALNAAIVAFKQNDFDKALDLVNQGITQAPSDAVLHEFRSLVLFAKGDYQQSASTIHAVLAVGPGWNWTTLSSLYDSVSVYTGQLRALEAVVRNQPEDSAARFLLAYHYMTAGHTEDAARHFRQVVALKPSDRVAADLLKLTAKTEASLAPAPSPGDGSAATSTPVDPALLVGTWMAKRDDGSQFALSLSNDSKFSWKYSQMGDKVQEFSGKYTMEGDVLALEGADGGSLVATVKPGSEKSFNFKLLGAPEEDQGLEFAR